MPSLRTCLVSIRDANGVRHSVEVTAETLYEAAALGFHALRRDDWAVPDASGGLLEVEVMPVPTLHRVPVAAIRRWLRGPSRSPRERLLKERISGLLDEGQRTNEMDGST